MSAGTRYSASHPILAIRSCFNLEGYSVGVVLRFVGFGPPVPQKIRLYCNRLSGEAWFDPASAPPLPQGAVARTTEMPARTGDHFHRSTLTILVC